MKNKSIVKNAVLNAIKTVSTIIFPLITFPYVSRVLQVENMGEYNYCTSIISYFTLLAGLGINTYAIREGAMYRDDREKMSCFASEIFSINFVATLVSYALLFALIFFVPAMSEERIILLILSISIVFTTIGCEWIFTIYEDFGYITIRSITFQIISLILLFTFVHSKDDLVTYVILNVVANSGACVVNFFSRRKYCSISFVFNKNMITRLVPIFILFANTIATTIYINSDMTMVGVFSGNYSAGLYSVSTKLYFIIKNLLSAIIVVSIPRLAAYVGEKDIKKYNDSSQKIFNSLLVIVAPAVVGLFSISNNTIYIIAGKEYLEATLSLQILSIALLFCLFGWFYTSCVLIPHKQEQKVLIATITAASFNICLNFILIPRWGHNAAAFTTVVAELISLLICYYYGRKFFKCKLDCRDLISIVFGNIEIFIICKLANYIISDMLVSTIICVVLSGVCYVCTLKIAGNSTFDYLLKLMLKKAKKG